MSDLTKEALIIFNAVLSGYETVNPDMAEGEKQTIRFIVSSACNRAQEREIKDMLAFIRWSKRNNRRPGWMAGNLMHDLNGIAGNDGPCFLPRTSGYSDIMDMAPNSPLKGVRS